jgi:hypothetical protein
MAKENIECDQLPACDRDWFLQNGQLIMDTLRHRITLDKQSQGLVDLESCKSEGEKSND